jgi:hypothetical protein
MSKKAWSLLSVGIIAAAISLRADVVKPEGPNNTAPAGYVALFDGKTMDGWNGRKGDINPEVVHAMSPDELKANQDKWNEDRDKHWHVDTDKAELVSDGHGVFLATQKDYHNFEMWVDWLMVAHNGDSGIYLRGYPQVQIWDPDNESVAKLGAPKGSGALWNDRDDNPGKWPLVKADNPVGEWNTFHIKMVDKKVWVWFNGKLTVDGSVLDNYWHKKDNAPIIGEGPLELQTHGSEIRFRNIYVRELDDAGEPKK